MAQIGLPGQRLDVLAGDDVDGATGRLMSVADLQHALQVAFAATRTPAAENHPRGRADHPDSDEPSSGHGPDLPGPTRLRATLRVPNRHSECAVKKSMLVLTLVGCAVITYADFRAGSTTYTWQSGWVVYSDLNRDGVINANEPVLRVQKPLSSSDDFQDAAKTVTQVRFNREGFATGLPNAGALLVLHDKTATRAWTRCLSISMVGMLTTQTNTSSSSCL